MEDGRHCFTGNELLSLMLVCTPIFKIYRTNSLPQFNVSVLVIGWSGGSPGCT